MSYSVYFGADSEEPQDGSLELLWPALKYDIDVICDKSDGSLGLFEKTLLDMLKVTHGTELELADALCMERDTVRFLLERLEHKNYIDSNGIPVAGGKSDKQLDFGEHKLFIVFYDALGQKFFPWMYEEQDVLKSDVAWLPREITDEVRYYLGESRSDERFRKAYCLQPDAEKWQHVVTSNEIISLLQKNRKSFQAGGHYTSGITGERVFLRVWLCRNSSTGNYMIQGPFKREYMPRCIRTIKKLEKEKDKNHKLIDLMMTKLSSLTEYEITEQNMGKQVPHGFNRHLFNYPTMAHHIGELERDWKNILAGEQNSELAVNNRKNYSKAFYQSGFSAIEESLRIVYGWYAGDGWDERLLAMHASARRKFLLKIVKNIGFKLNKDFRSERLVDFSEIKLRRFVEEGSVTLPVVLALNIACASSDRAHPFWRLANKDRNIFDFISSLRDGRNEAAHGKEVELKTHQARDDYKRFLDFISYMLPEIMEEIPTRSDNSSKNDWQNEILRAKSALRNRMGFRFISDVDHNLVDPMVLVEQKRLELSENSIDFQNRAQNICNSCAGILQECLQKRMSGVEVDRSLKGNKIQSLAAELLINYGCLQEAKLPVVLRTVKKAWIEKAGQEDDRGSLGSEYLAWMGYNPRGEVSKLAEAYPEEFRVFYHTVTDLLTYRGHGSEVSKEISLAELDTLIDNFAKCITLFWENGLLNEERSSVHV